MNSGHRLIKHVFALFAAVFVAGCMSSPREGSGTSVPLEGTVWRLVSVDGKASVLPDRGPGSEFILDAQSGRFSAMVGVNRLAGDYRSSGSQRGTIEFPDRIISTKMAGPPELMEQDRAFVAALTSVDSFAVIDGELTLSERDAARLVFRGNE